MSKSAVDRFFDLFKDPTWASLPSDVKVTYVKLKNIETSYSLVKGEEGHMLRVAMVSDGTEVSWKQMNLPAIDEEIAQMITWRDKLAKLEGKE